MVPSALCLSLALLLCVCAVSESDAPAPVAVGDSGSAEQQGEQLPVCGHRCVDGVCIDASLVCDGHEDCADGTDEHTAVTCTMPVFNASASPCDRAHEYQCYDGTCIDQSKVCDRNFDCADHTDEAHVIACD